MSHKPSQLVFTVLSHENNELKANSHSNEGKENEIKKGEGIIFGEKYSYPLPKSR